VLSKATGVLLLLSLFGYVAAIVIGDVFAYIFCFALLVLVILFGFLVLTAHFIWEVLPANLKTAHQLKRSRFTVTILLSVPLAFVLAGSINKEYLSDSSGLVSLLGNMGVFVFAVFVAWSFIRRSKWRIIFVSSGIFVLFVALLSFAGSIVPKLPDVANTDAIEKLKTLGYLDWVPAETENGSGIIKAGVTHYDRELAFDGLNVYCSRMLAEAYLIDMLGNVVHKWAETIEGGNTWRHAEMCENGDLLVIAADQMLICLDWDSNIKWQTKMRPHHDVSLDADKQVYALSRKEMLVSWYGIPIPIPNDDVVVLSSDGEIKKEVYLYELVSKAVPLRRIVEIYKEMLNPERLKDIIKRKARHGNLLPHGSRFDIMHTNTIEIMDRDIEGFCSRGDWLISIRELDLIGVLDAEKLQFVWSWGPGELNRQHHPTLLENGNILIFDNGPDRGFTRIVELDPLSKKIVWEYKSQPPERFFSAKRGGCQRLPNGNILITESDRGHVFEVTSEGKIVWEFYNPVVEKKKSKREAIYRMMRVTYPAKL